MLKYILLFFISGLLIAPYWIESLLTIELVSSVETICTRLMLILLAILIFKKEWLTPVYKNTLFSIVLVVNLFFLFNYISAIATDYSTNDIHFIGETNGEQE